ncbi:hypothetical protein K438DRAFT_1851588 [Mycena galopus ATCC 62051]|nr:hypothetical protein K438DRAFT_1851588 [Mycena galopus ATCC 62051]
MDRTARGAAVISDERARQMQTSGVGVKGETQGHNDGGTTERKTGRLEPVHYSKRQRIVDNADLQLT